MFKEAKEYDENAVEKVKEAYDFLEAFLEGREWLAGDEVTIADLCNIATVSTLDALLPIDEEKHGNLAAWIAKCKELPCYGCNVEGLELLKAAVEEKMNA